MKIVTINIKCDSTGHAPDSPLGRNTFAARRDYLKARIRKEAPDIMGFQETQPHMVAWLKENLPEYVFMGHGRGADFADEAMILAVKKDKFELWGFETFWLSPTPYVPGSRYENQSDCPRTCAAAFLRCAEFDFPFRVYVTHLDHISDEARQLGMAAIVERIKADNAKIPAPCILMGDMNAFPGTIVFDPLKEIATMRDVTEDVGNTFHGFGTWKETTKIDYIFVTEPFADTDARRWHEEHDGIYLSDHDPVSVELK